MSKRKSKKRVFYGWQPDKGWYYPTIERALKNKSTDTLYRVTIKDGEILESKEMKMEQIGE